jgi:hypothetical protein
MYLLPGTAQMIYIFYRAGNLARARELAHFQENMQTVPLSAARMYRNSSFRQRKQGLREPVNLLNDFTMFSFLT